MKLIYRIKPPCTKCPYTLGLVRTLKNPCPECKMDHYQTFEQLKKIHYYEKNNVGIRC